MSQISHKSLKNLRGWELLHVHVRLCQQSFFTRDATVSHLATGHENEQVSVCSKGEKCDVTGTECQMLQAAA